MWILVGRGQLENKDSVSVVNSSQFALARLTKVRFGDQVVGVLSGMEMIMGRQSELRDVFVVQSWS